MGRYIVRRLLYSVFVVLGASSLVFALTFLSGDPVRLFLGMDATPEQVERVRHQLGYDRPIYVQYVDFVGRAVRGDFGASLQYNQPAMQLVLQQFPASLQLAVVALAVTLLISTPAGILGAVKRNSFFDRLSLVIALLGQSMPVFWLGIVLILVFAVTLRWLPASGGGSVESLILPGLTLGAYSTAITTRLLRSSLIEVMGQDYVRTARAKGLRERGILVGHALKNASIPVVTVIGLQAGALLGGALITETVFSYPGLGRLAMHAISTRDVPVVQAFVVVAASLVVLINLAVDVSYAWLDPRIKHQ
ncbi:MAG: ABC transporter permease [Chloroflexi bacterium]|nr:ABC transporter permease [Chloroflexota bacterium]